MIEFKKVNACHLFGNETSQLDNVDLVLNMEEISNSLESRMYIWEREGNSILLNGLFRNSNELLENIFGNDVKPLTLQSLAIKGMLFNNLRIRGYFAYCSNLDMQLINRYGTRKVSKAFSDCVSFLQFNRMVVDNNIYYSLCPENIKSIIFNKFMTKWEELYDTINKKYDVLKPFDISLIESESDKLKTLQDTSNRVVNENLKTDYQTLKDKSTNTSSDKVYGFNSETGVNSESGDSSTENEFSSLNNDTKTGITTDTRNYERDITKSRDYSRSGNIGNRSYSELIIKEREKLMFNLQDIILEDIASVLCSYTY